MTRWSALITVIVAARIASADSSPEAMRLYQEGQVAFDAHRYDDAIAAWQRSYDLSHAPLLLYNVAQAFRLRAHVGDCAAARGWYDRFMAVAPPSPQRDLAQQYVAQLATCASPPPSAPPPPNRSASPSVAQPLSNTAAQMDHGPSRSLRDRKIAVAATAGAGVVLLAAGLALGAHASALGNQVTSACAVSCDWSVEKPKDAAGRLDTALGYTFDTIGVLALVGSATAYWFGVHESELRVAPIGSSSRASGAVLSWRGTW